MNEEPLELVRGAHAFLNFDDLLGGDGQPADFHTGDILLWAAKAHFGDPAALLELSSEDGQITFVDGEDSAIGEIVPDDWTNLPWLRADQPFVWELEYLPGGNADLLTPLARGEGLIHPDVSADGPAEIQGMSGGGPCEPWTTVTAVQADDRCKRPSGDEFDLLLLSEMIDVASEVLYRATARLFPGECSDVVFPDVRPATSVPSASAVLSGSATRVPYFPDFGRSPRSEFDSLSKVSLGRYPIRTITEVKIDGVALAPSEYMVLNRRWLVRVGGAWPVGSDLLGDPDDTDQRTFRVSFTWGDRPPASGVAAIKTFVIELAKGACGDPCALPERIQSIVQQSMSFALLDPMTFLDSGRTGMYQVDQFIASVNPKGARRRASVINPDLPRPVVRRQTFP